jgi:hypothetical protein
MSVFSKKYWMNKGFSEEEAVYQISIRRPNNILYYINKGFSEQEAKELVRARQSKGGKARANLSREEKRKFTPRCVEFWINKGFNLEEAKAKVSEQQTTFSKKKCIEKHGEEEGLRIWKKRQERWQETLSNKPETEISEINSRKNRWKNLTDSETNKLKTKIAKAVSETCSTRTLQEKRELGKKLSEARIRSGIATPIEKRDAFQEYRNCVSLETARHDLSKLDNFDKRGPTEYHLDHKYSVFEGFKNNIPAEIIGHICNLEMIPFDQNTSKGSKCSISLDYLKESIEKYNNVNKI